MEIPNESSPATYTVIQRPDGHFEIVPDDLKEERIRQLNAIALGGTFAVEHSRSGMSEKEAEEALNALQDNY